MKKYWIWLLLVLCNLFWAGNYIFGKYVIGEMTPLWITYSRWALALLLLLPIAHYFEKPNWKAVMQHWMPLAVMGALGAAGFNLVLYSALKYTSATNAALVSSMNPGVIVVFSVLLFKEKISIVQASGFIISLTGTMVILTQGNLGQVFQLEYNKGDLLMLVAVLVWMLYSFIGKHITLPPITATAASTLFAVLLMTPFAFAQGINIAKISPLGITAIIYMVIFPSVCSFIFWNMSVQAIGASQTGVSLNLIPVFTAIISALLGEKITSPQIWGGLLVFLGVYLTTGMLDAIILNRNSTEKN